MSQSNRLNQTRHYREAPMSAVRQYTVPGVHHRVVQQGILQTSTVHVWDFSKPRRRPLWQTATMGLFLSICAFVLIAETILWLVSR